MMRFFSILALAFLGAAAFLLAVPAESRADAPGAADGAPVAAALDPVPLQPGTDAEEAAYAMREAQSPESGEFEGGHCGFALFVVVVAAVVILILYLQKEGKV